MVGAFPRSAPGAEHSRQSVGDSEKRSRSLCTPGLHGSAHCGVLDVSRGLSRSLHELQDRLELRGPGPGRLRAIGRLAGELLSEGFGERFEALSPP